MKYLSEYLVGAIYLAIVYSLVRPGSPAAGVVQTVSNALVAVVSTATGFYTTVNPYGGGSTTPGGTPA